MKRQRKRGPSRINPLGFVIGMIVGLVLLYIAFMFLARMLAG